MRTKTRRRELGAEGCRAVTAKGWEERKDGRCGGQRAEADGNEIGKCVSCWTCDVNGSWCTGVDTVPVYLFPCSTGPRSGRRGRRGRREEEGEGRRRDASGWSGTSQNNETCHTHL